MVLLMFVFSVATACPCWVSVLLSAISCWGSAPRRPLLAMVLFLSLCALSARFSGGGCGCGHVRLVLGELDELHDPVGDGEPAPGGEGQAGTGRLPGGGGAEAGGV